MDNVFLLVLNIICAIILILWFISWIRKRKRIKEAAKVSQSSKAATSNHSQSE